MTVYAKIKNDKLITAHNGYNGITGFASNVTAMAANGFIAYPDDEISGYYAGTWAIVNGILTDISQSTEYIAQQLSTKSTQVYKNILSAYDYILKYGVFALDDTYYANMAWYKTWTKVTSIYSNPPAGFTPPETFSIRLYTDVDDIYYNSVVSSSLSDLSSKLSILNSKQILYYQPIRDNLINQLQIHVANQDLDGIEAVDAKIESYFGDHINEQEEIVSYA